MNQAGTQTVIRCPAGLSILAVLVLLAGCEGQPTEDDSNTPPTTRANVKLLVLVVDDAPMAAAIERQTGEWQARTGGQLEVVRIASAALLESKTLKADAVIYPQRHLGHLATHKLIVPVRPKLLEREAYDAADVFQLVQHRVLTWGNQPMAVPLGSPILVLYYRADLLKQLDRQPPQTWEEYSQLAALLADREKLGDLAPPDDQPWHGCLEPVGENWAAITLLARAASYAKHRNSLAVLFDIESMEPQIAGPPFQKVLEDMQAAGLDTAPAMNPAEVRQAMHAGQCGMALIWPSAAAAMPDGKRFEVAISELPGARQVYKTRESSWQAVDGDQVHRVPLLGVDGRIGSVTSTTRNVPTALRFLAWLSGKEVSRQVSTSSSSTTLFRRSHLRTSSAWTEKGLSSQAITDYTNAIQVSLQSTDWFSVVRIPHAQEYLMTLDQSVRESLAGKATSHQALEAASQQWQQITEKAGREAQRQAYLKSLGL